MADAVHPIESNIRADIMMGLDNNTLKLPSIPEVISKINQIVDDPKGHMSQIAKLVQMDGAVTVRLLQIANSPALRGFKEVNTVTDAVTRLGLNTVKNVIMAIMIREQFNSSNPILKSVLARVWERSITLAVFGFHMSKQHSYLGLNPDVAMTGGILFYVSALPIIEYFDRGLGPTNWTEADIEQIIERLRVDINIRILSKWHISDHVIDAAAKPQMQTSNNSTYGDLLLAIHKVLTAGNTVSPSDRALKSPSRNVLYDTLLSMLFSVDAEVIELKRTMLAA